MSSIKVFLKDQYFALLNIFDGDDLFYQLGKPLILNYHHIIPDSRVENNLLFGYAHSTTSFESQIKWLAQHFRKSQDFDTQNSFVITFDDCSQHTFELALPVLEKYGMKAYFFMVENTIGTTIWIDRYFFWLSYAPTAKYHLFDKEYTLDNHKSRIAAHHKLWSLYESNIEYSEILDEMEKAYPFSNLETDSNRLEKRLNTLS
ncbi:MAG: polysaccharide deacetylase family protein, partial [Candidatus Paceibacterota bacterium]